MISVVTKPKAESRTVSCRALSVDDDLRISVKNVPGSWRISESVFRSLCDIAAARHTYLDQLTPHLIAQLLTHGFQFLRRPSVEVTLVTIGDNLIDVAYEIPGRSQTAED